MTDTQSQIAARLEACFAQCGFTEPGVDALSEASGFSLRTVYKYFPSREAMIIGALDHRHRRYLAFLEKECPTVPGHRATVHLFRRVGAWMASNAPQGCLFVNALAAHPNNKAIQSTLERHKLEIRAVIAKRLGSGKCADPLVNQLMILHEGLTAHAVTVGGKDATEATLAVVCSLVPKEDDS